jgi:hypothetical protein
MAYCACARANLVPPIRSVYKQMYEFLDGLLRHKSDMVNIEAARALTEVKNIDQATLYRPVAGEWNSFQHVGPADNLVP